MELFDTTFIRQKGSIDEEIRKSANLVLPTDISHLYHPHTDEEVDKMLVHKMNAFSPDLVAISLVEDNYDYGNHLLTIVKLLDRNIRILAGGTLPSAVPDVIIENPNIDYVCEGDGEDFIIEFCRLMSQKKTLSNIGNLWYKKNGEIRHNPLRPFKDMNTLIPQRLDIWDKGHFIKPYNGKLYKTGSFELARGCPNKCSYCINKRLQDRQRICGPFHRSRTVKNLLDEIELQNALYKFELIFIQDDNFLLMPKSKLEEFSRDWNRRIKLPYWIATHLNLITEQKLTNLKNSGCCGIGLGLESGNEWIRKSILNRSYINNQQIIAKFNLIKKSGIRITVNSMIGLPDESEEDIFETIKLNRLINPDSIDINFLAPYIGTDIYALARERGYLDTRIEPGFKGMVDNITVRKYPVMNLPQISHEKLIDIFYKFTDYVYGHIDIPEEFQKSLNPGLLRQKSQLPQK